MDMLYGTTRLTWSMGRSRRASDRQSILRDELSRAISNAVRRSNPSCEGFIGVLLEPKRQNCDDDANWEIRGIKFGTAERSRSSQVIDVIVKRLQREFDVADFDLVVREEA
jgi:hypothetical protein